MSGGDESSARRKKTERRPTKKDKRTQGQRTGSSDEAVRGARSKTENVPSRWKEEEMVVVGEGREKEKEKEREREKERRYKRNKHEETTGRPEVCDCGCEWRRRRGDIGDTARSEVEEEQRGSGKVLERE